MVASRTRGSVVVPVVGILLHVRPVRRFICVGAGGARLDPEPRLARALSPLERRRLSTARRSVSAGVCQGRMEVVDQLHAGGVRSVVLVVSRPQSEQRLGWPSIVKDVLELFQSTSQRFEFALVSR
jgi:hypothetical protein